MISFEQGWERFPAFPYYRLKGTNVVVDIYRKECNCAVDSWRSVHGQPNRFCEHIYGLKNWLRGEHE